MDQVTRDRLTRLYGREKAGRIAEQAKQTPDLHFATSLITGNSREKCRMLFEDGIDVNRYKLEEST